MREFKPLTAALADHYEKPFADLPSSSEAPGLRERVAEAFYPFTWTDLSPSQRRQLALQWDNQNDPALEEERQRAWDMQVKCSDLEREIEDWQVMPAATPTERIAKEDRIAALRSDLASAIRERDALDAVPVPEVGRPTSRPLIAAELERRITRGELEAGVATQARALEAWLVANHPQSPKTTAATIEINIRKRFKEARNSRKK